MDDAMRGMARLQRSSSMQEELVNVITTKDRGNQLNSNRSNVNPENPNQSHSEIRDRLESLDETGNSNPIKMGTIDNQPSNSSTLQLPLNQKNGKIEYSRGHSIESSHHSHSSVCSGYSDQDGSYETGTQKIYYEQLKLTPVPKKKTIDKNRLIGILQNLPLDTTGGKSGGNVGSANNSTGSP